MLSRLISCLTTCLFGEPITVNTVKKEVNVSTNEPITGITVKKEVSMSEADPSIADHPWDAAKIKKKIGEISQEIKLLKKEIRTPYHQVTWKEQTDLASLKHQVTVLMVLQAFRRGKLHFTRGDRSNWALDSHESWLEENLDWRSWTDLVKIKTV